MKDLFSLYGIFKNTFSSLASLPLSVILYELIDNRAHSQSDEVYFDLNDDKSIQSSNNFIRLC